MWTEPLGDETQEACPCCGRPIFEGEGVLLSEDGERAQYAYRWPEGHEGRFTLGICPIDANGSFYAGLAAVTCRNDGSQLIYTVLEPDASPWGDTEATGKVLTREQLLHDGAIPDLFDLVDAIASREERISSRIMAS
jgi:hypothetical protein